MSDSKPVRTLRVVIVDDHYVVREGVRRLLEEAGEIVVVASLGSAEQLMAEVAELKPDAVVTDIRMPPDHHMEGIEAAHALRAQMPEVGIVVLSQYAHESYAFELLKNGTSGLAYLLKDRVGEPDHLLRAVREVCAGGSMIDSRVVDALVLRHSRREQSALESLTPRELEVLHQMAQGKNNAGIAAALVLSASAVEKHVSSILGKLGRSDEDGIDRRVAAVLQFLQG